jgi:hypothetical protein
VLNARVWCRVPAASASTTTKSGYEPLSDTGLHPKSAKDIGRPVADIEPGIDDEFDGEQSGIIGILGYNMGQETAGVVAGNETGFLFGILVPNVIQNGQASSQLEIHMPIGQSTSNNLFSLSLYGRLCPQGYHRGASSNRSVGPVPVASPVPCCRPITRRTPGKESQENLFSY